MLRDRFAPDRMQFGGEVGKPFSTNRILCRLMACGRRRNAGLPVLTARPLFIFL